VTTLPLIPAEPPEYWLSEAKERWSPIYTYCLFSGGNDSGVLAHRCRGQYDRLLFIDTGLAVPGVVAHVRRYAQWIEKPLLILSSGDAYREMVLTYGFPGKGQHGLSYSRLKERRIEEALRITKEGFSRKATVLFISGVRRDESRRRANRAPLTERFSAKFCNPLISWSNAEMRIYREEHGIPESDVAALLHRSGECNCGAFADAESERAMMEGLWPEWWRETIEPLERDAEAAGLRWCRWGGYDLDGVQAAGSGPEPGLLCSDCPRQLAMAGAPIEEEPIERPGGSGA